MRGASSQRRPENGEERLQWIMVGGADTDPCTQEKRAVPRAGKGGECSCGENEHYCC